MAFKYAIRQRVNVPGMVGVQGMVTARTDYSRGESSYRVDYVASNGGDGTAWHLESEMDAANKTPVVKPADIARKLRKRKR